LGIQDDSGIDFAHSNAYCYHAVNKNEKVAFLPGTLDISILLIIVLIKSEVSILYI
jgi:hypothetical protein